MSGTSYSALRNQQRLRFTAGSFLFPVLPAVYAIMDTNNNRRKRNDPHRVRGYSPLLAHPFAEGGVNMDEIFKRGTCRHFKELTPVAKENLLTLVKAGMQARACGNQEAREFIIVTRDDLVKAISHNSLVAGPARKAGAAIVIVGKKENISFPEEWSFDCAAAAENILIEAEHLGLGSIWLQVYPYADRKAHLLNILDIPAEMEPFCIIAIGYAERKPVRMNRYNERIIYNDLYGSRKK